MFENRAMDENNKPTIEYPLVTLALFAYNQERFIEQAVGGAFSQTYSPLEIILSDDFSTDRTFEIMREMVAGYSGSHRVILNQNPRNLGIGEHINKVFEISSCELVVMAAGDDVSLSERVEKLVDSWVKNKKPSAMESNFIGINADGDELIDTVFKKDRITSINKVSFSFNAAVDYLLTKSSFVGATEACTKKLFEIFGPIPSDVINEDQVIAFRAILLDGILQVPENLVKYRFHSSNVYSDINYATRNVDQTKQYETIENRQIKTAERRVNVIAANISDLTTARDRKILEWETADHLILRAKKELAVAQLIAGWWGHNCVFKSIYLIKFLFSQRDLETARWGLKRLMSYNSFFLIKRLKARFIHKYSIES